MTLLYLYQIQWTIFIHPVSHAFKQILVCDITTQQLVEHRPEWTDPALVSKSIHEEEAPKRVGNDRVARAKGLNSDPYTIDQFTLHKFMHDNREIQVFSCRDNAATGRQTIFKIAALRRYLLLECDG